MRKPRLGDNLYALRKRRGLSQEEFAEKIHISRQAVSKWERGEAYPDTENLIEIAEFYGVTLDELVHADDLSPRGEAAGEDRTDYDSGRGWSVTVSPKDEPEDGTDATDAENSERKGRGVSVKGELHFNWSDLPYPIIITVAYLLLGFLAPRGFAVWWTLYVTVPVYYSLCDCIRTKRFTPFAYPVFVAFVYLLVGMLTNIWHPTWVIFVTVPIYYSIAAAIDRKNGRVDDEDEDKDEDEDEDEPDSDDECDGE